MPRTMPFLAFPLAWLGWAIRLPTFAAAAMLAVGAAAQPALDERARAMAQAAVDAGEFRRLVIGVVDEGRSAVFGFARGGETPPYGRSIYEIGSVTKTFTGLLLAQDIINGRLQPDDPVGPLLPGMRVPDFEGRPITLLDLATHTSGLPRLPSNLDLTQLSNPYARYDTKALGAFLAGHRLQSRPGDRFEYSNLGHGLLGQALATRAGQTYGELVRARILAPLGMTSTGVVVDAEMRARLVPGHGPDGQPVPNWDFDALAGAGALKSDADDMLRYLKAVMHGSARPDTPFGLAQAPLRDTGMGGMRIGYGWLVADVQGRRVTLHNGMTGGYASFIGFTTDGRRGVVVLADAMRTVDPIAIAALLPPQASAASPSSSQAATGS
jgi:serine-type D-Ala-D-Ala carboxypeptidase/endopeptidase